MQDPQSAALVRDALITARLLAPAESVKPRSRQPSPGLVALDAEAHRQVAREIVSAHGGTIARSLALDPSVDPQLRAALAARLGRV